MAKKVLSPEQIEQLVKLYNNGYGASPANLSKTFGVHPTTIRRYLRQAGEVLREPSVQSSLAYKDKLLMRNILLNCKVSHPDKVIKELEKEFTFSRKEKDEDYTVFNL